MVFDIKPKCERKHPSDDAPSHVIGAKFAYDSGELPVFRTGEDLS